MSTDPSKAPAPGWYPDPAGSGGQRWWDGTAWTQQTSAPAYHQDAPAYGGYASAAAPTIPGVPAGTPVYTWFLWVIVLLPLVSLALLPLANVAGMVDTVIKDPYAGPFAIFTPGYIALMVFGWISYLGSVALAFGDHRALTRLGYVHPFHWAWAFLSSPVYAIGRSVVVNRRAGRGLLPIWIVIAIYVLTFVVAMVLVAGMMSVIFANLPEMVHTGSALPSA